MDCPNADGSSPKLQKFPSIPEICIDTEKRYSATFNTTKGTFIAALDAIKAPVTVNNFVFLARYHFYDQVTFHRIIPGFVLQGGDPIGSGSGGPGYRFDDELPKQGQYQIGSLAMANAGPNTNGSQFFVISGSSGASLPPLYALFGQVVKGLEVVAEIDGIGTQSGRPKETVMMESVTITETD